MRQIVQAIFYVLRSGCPWSLLPVGFPPSGTVRHWFARFQREGLFLRVSHRLVMMDRERYGPRGQRFGGRYGQPDGANVRERRPKGL